jgi:hypothetical protein
MGSLESGAVGVVDNMKSLKFNGVYYNKFHYEENHKYIRFYENGTVLTVTSNGTIRQIKEWFNIDNKNVGDSIGIGNFKIDRNEISFQIKYGVKHRIGIISYNGNISDNGLWLNEHYRGGYECIYEYTFAQWDN